MDSEPITILSGESVSCKAVPSRRNSGHEATATFELLDLFLLIASSIFLFVPTGTVLLQDTILKPVSNDFPIFFATLSTVERSASPFFLGGVPTVNKNYFRFRHSFFNI